MITKARMATTKAFRITEMGIRLLNALHCLFVATLKALHKSVNVVVVLIPPPVDPGEAPININMINKNKPAFVNSLTG